MFRTTRDCLALADLRKVPVTMPPHGPGKMWQGVQHGQLMDKLLDEAVHNLGLTVDRAAARFWVTKDGGDMAAAVPVPTKSFSKYGLTPYLGVAASNRQEMALTAYAGAVDTQTGMPIVPGRLKRNKDKRWMYTTHFDFDYVVEKIWKWWFSQMVNVTETWERWDAAPGVSAGRLNNLLVTLGRKEILPWSRVGTADRAFARSPDRRHTKFVEAVSVPLSMASPLDQLDGAWKLTTLVNNVTSKKAEKV